MARESMSVKSINYMSPKPVPSRKLQSGGKSRIVGLGAVAALLAGLVACAPANDSGTTSAPEVETETDAPEFVFEPLVLSFATNTGPGTAPAKHIEAWMALITERTNGAVTFDMFYQEALCPTLELMPCVRDGRADMAQTSPIFEPAAFPGASMIGVPWVSENPVAVMRAFDRVVAESESLQAEFEANNVHWLVSYPTATVVLGTNEPVDSIDWLRGKSVRGIGLTAQALEAIGANPVAVPVGELYEAMSRGVVEAWYGTNFGNAVLDFNMGEVTTHIADTGTGNTFGGGVLMNKDRWDSLPPELQTVFQEAIAEISGSEYETEYLVPVLDELCAKTKEQGITLSIWSDAEKKRWADIVADDLYQSWLEGAVAGGAVNAAEDFERWVANVRAIEPETFITTEVAYCLSKNG